MGSGPRRDAAAGDMPVCRYRQLVDPDSLRERRTPTGSRRSASGALDAVRYTIDPLFPVRASTTCPRTSVDMRAYTRFRSHFTTYPRPPRLLRSRLFRPDGDLVRFNPLRGNREERNARRNVIVALSITDSGDSHPFFSLSGKVVEITEDGAVDPIHELTRGTRTVAGPMATRDRCPRDSKSRRRVSSRERVASGGLTNDWLAEAPSVQ